MGNKRSRRSTRLTRDELEEEEEQKEEEQQKEEEEQKEEQEEEEQEEEEREDMGMDVDVDKPAKGGWQGKKEGREGCQGKEGTGKEGRGKKVRLHLNLFFL